MVNSYGQFTPPSSDSNILKFQPSCMWWKLRRDMRTHPKKWHLLIPDAAPRGGLICSVLTDSLKLLASRCFQQWKGFSRGLLWFSGNYETLRRPVDSSNYKIHSSSASLESRSLLQPGIINGPEKVVKLFYFQTQFYANICRGAAPLHSLRSLYNLPLQESLIMLRGGTSHHPDQFTSARRH